MSDETLDKLGTYFVHFSILKRFGIPFHQFIKIAQRGDWEGFVSEQNIGGSGND